MLSRRFGEEQVFMDLGIEPGVNFVEQINEAVGSCRLLLAVIGPHWASMPDADGRRRLDDPADFIRIEIEAGLRRAEVRVVPVLVQGARMPSIKELPPSLADLAQRNALELSDARWRYDVDRLTSTIERVLGVRARPSGVSERPELPAAAAEAGVGRGPPGPPPGAGPVDHRLRGRPAAASWLRRHSRLALSLTLIALAAAVGIIVIARPGASSDHELWNPGGKYPSPAGIELSHLRATGEHKPVRADDRIKIEFSLKNVGSSQVTFEETFIAARNPDGDNKDFGEENLGKPSAPGQVVQISRSIVVDAPGTWEFWPCYYLRRHAGECPDEWQSFQVAVRE